MRLDAHQHYWRPARGDYGWLDSAPPLLRQDYLPQDLAPAMQALGITGTILVQAAPSLAESRFLLELADQHETIRGVVGWVDVAAEDAVAQLASLAAHPKLVGIRPMLQDIADTNFILRPACAPLLEALERRGLAFDALIQPRHLPVIDRLKRRHPGLRLVLDHGAKPDFRADLAAWQDGIAALAAHGDVHCKLSGLVTEAGPGWSVEMLAPVAGHLRACFGPQRLMWGSDWPVLLATAGYADWHAAARGLVAEEEWAAVAGGTAAGFYRL